MTQRLTRSHNQPRREYAVDDEMDCCDSDEILLDARQCISDDHGGRRPHVRLGAHCSRRRKEFGLFYWTGAAGIASINV